MREEVGFTLQNERRLGVKNPNRLTLEMTVFDDPEAVIPLLPVAVLVPAKLWLSRVDEIVVVGVLLSFVEGLSGGACDKEIIEVCPGDEVVAFWSPGIWK